MRRNSPSDLPFYFVASVICAAYVLLIVAMLAADAVYLAEATGNAPNPTDTLMMRIARHPLALSLADPNIRDSIRLSLISTTITAILSVAVAVPVGYLFSRHHFWGKNFLDAILDIPFVLPPLVVGLSLLILFQYVDETIRDRFVYQVPGVVLAQFIVAGAFAVRVMRATFDQLDPRPEQVALTLGCSRAQAFWKVVLPDTGPGLLTAGTLAWARALGEFGPLLVFAGATRGKTEVLSTTVFLELGIGNLQGAVAVSFIMIFAAVVVLVATRRWGARHLRL